MSNDFSAYLADLRDKLNRVATVSEEKDIAYGHQFKVVQGSEKVVHMHNFALAVEQFDNFD